MLSICSRSLFHLTMWLAHAQVFIFNGNPQRIELHKIQKLTNHRQAYIVAILEVIHLVLFELSYKQSGLLLYLNSLCIVECSSNLHIGIPVYWNTHLICILLALAKMFGLHKASIRPP